MPNVSHELIPIQKRRGEEQWVDARTLHAFVQSKQKFADWISNYITDFGFIEGRDFFLNLGKSTGGRQAIEYSITLDMAKHLAMLQRSKKGMQARQYFIECEKEMRRLQGFLLKEYEDAEEKFKDVFTIEEDGHIWYACAQLTLQVGRQGTGCGYQARVRKLAKEGKVKKIMYRGRLAWFVRKDFVREALNVHRRMIVASQVVTLIEKGGML
jgi:phage anti-repressor protein